MTIQSSNVLSSSKVREGLASPSIVISLTVVFSSDSFSSLILKFLSKTFNFFFDDFYNVFSLLGVRVGPKKIDQTHTNLGQKNDVIAPGNSFADLAVYAWDRILATRLITT